MPIYYEDASIRIHKVNCGPYDNNAYLIVDPSTEEGIVIDAPAESEKLLAEIGSAKVKAIVISHTHRDHILGFDVMVDALKAPVGCHPQDAHLLPRPADFDLADNETVHFGGQAAQFLFTPGHTPGGTCTLVGRHLFPGDVLFPGGPGRTTSPENFQQLVANIRERILVLPDDVEVYPGHGANATLKQSKEEYASFASRTHPADLSGDVLWLKS
ncbi:MAG: Glyoxylase, beta-lactamase superfamily II [Chloroflexi bacterium]|jgi:glyoxylase-like metal-dependent hydrolase (beta-lactamase superfamily II)|nr:MAG: Glyoxylase, beta-lactamase superfamily II [Chloroflexota bacterium]